MHFSVSEAPSILSATELQRSNWTVKKQEMVMFPILLMKKCSGSFWILFFRKLAGIWRKTLSILLIKKQ